MHNPPHPGKVVQDFLRHKTIVEAAARLGITQASLSQIINGTHDISADTAKRLSETFGTSVEIWLRMQAKYNL